MIWLFILCLAAAVILLQRKLAGHLLDRLHYSVSCDALLAEPDQVLTLKTQLENRSRVPVLYLQLLTSLPAAAQLHEDEGWMEAHAHPRPLELCVEESTFLLPRRRRISRLRFSLPARGWYPLGSGVLSAGDFLGLREASRREESCSEVVVIPPAVETPALLQTLGGFFGDLSVRRFLLEDPVLTVGFREYTGHEPMKSISWTQSARTGRLMVRQYDYTTDRHVAVLLNTQGGSAAQLEQCYSLTRTVCQYLERQGISYAFATNGDLTGPMGFLTQLPEGLGQQHFHTILYGLGRARGRCRFSLQRLAELALQDRSGSRSYLLVTPPLGPGDRQVPARLRAAGGGLCLLVGEEQAS